MEFSEWITKKYLEWRGDSIGNVRSITRFASMLRVPQQIMNAWMSPGSDGPIKKKYIDALITQYGDEVYDVLTDLTRDGNIPISHLPPSLRRRLIQATQEVNTALADSGIAAEDPIAEQITIQIFEKHGFKYTATETE